jgi:hypothetical protein
MLAMFEQSEGLRNCARCMKSTVEARVEIAPSHALAEKNEFVGATRFVQQDK